MPIQTETPHSADVVALLQEHLEDMAAHSPPQSVHALDLAALQSPDVDFFAARTDAWELQGCAALKTLTPEHGELKSMRTVSRYLCRGVAARLLTHIIDQAKTRGMQRISLETGTPEAFEPARQLYLRSGFTLCPPFGDYSEDPYSVFMTLLLDGTSSSS